MRLILAATYAALTVSLLLSGSLANNAIDRIGFTQNSFTVVEGDSVDVTIFIETDDGLALDNNQDVTCIISDDASSQGNPALPLNRLIGDISSDAQGNPTVTFTVPVGTEDASELSFTGLSIENNNIMENTDLDFNLLIDGFSILQTTGGGISGFTTVTVEDDDDDPMIQLSASSYTVDESALNISICAELVNVLSPSGTASQIDVTLQIVDGTAVRTEDLSLPGVDSVLLSFPAPSFNGASACEVFDPIDDDIFEGDEMFQVVLSDPTGVANLASQSSASVTIVDDEVAEVSLQPLTSVNEGGSVPAVVGLLLQSGGSAIPITVTLATMNGTAQEGEDFMLSSTTITFPPSMLPIMVSVDAIAVDDSFVEGDQYFVISIDSVEPMMVTIGTQNSTSVTILDDDEDEATVAMDVANIEIDEDEGPTMFCASLSLTSGFSLQTSIIVPFIVDYGLTEMNMDFSIAADVDVFEFDSESQECFNVSIIDDQLLEFSENFTVTLNSSGADPIGINFGQLDTEIDILDDEERDGFLEVEESVITALETDDQVEVCVVVTGISATVETPFSVELVVSDGTAVFGEDFDHESPLYSNFVEGNDLTSCANISILNDAEYEGRESFSVVIQAVGDLSPQWPDTATIEIVDAEDATISFASSGPFSANEGDAIVIPMILEGVQTLVSIDVGLSGVSDSAVGEVDFMIVNPETIVPAVISGEDLDFDFTGLTFLNELIVEGDEEFTLHLPSQDMVDYTIGNISYVTVVIVNDDVATAAFQTSEFSAIETSNAVTISVDVTFLEGSEVDVTVPFTLMGVTATPDVDFDASPVNVTIDAFESNTSTVVSFSFQVDLTDDSILEFDEIFTVQFVENSVVDCLDPEANVTIIDDESDNTVDMESASVDAFEIDGVVTICARIFGVTEIERSFIGHIAFVLSSAVVGEDFTVVGLQALTFPVGPDNLGCIDISITNDPDYEGVEDFQVFLSDNPGLVGKRTAANTFSVPEGPVMGMTTPSTSIEIHDAEDAVVSFLNETIYTPENGTLTIPIFVQSMGSFQIPLVVQLTFVSTPLATEGVDFSTVETSVMVSAGFTNGEIEFSVDILPDSSVEGDHSFYISILDNGTFTIGSINQTEVIIVDDDICDVGVEIITMDAPYLIEGEVMSIEVCIQIVDMPGSFETSITIPLEIEDFVPKPGYGPYYNGYRKREAPYNGNPAEENEDFSLEMSFDNLIFPTSTMVNDVQCTNITILDDDIFEHLQVILVTIGESEPEGIKMDESLKINILDDEINDTVITVLNTTTVELEEAKLTLDICAELNVSEVQTKTVARFAVLLDRSLIEFAPSGNFTCRNDSSLSFPLAYLCEGPPDKYGHYRKRYAEDYYGPYDYIDCPDGSDESPETCGDRRNYEFRPGNELAVFKESPVACATLDIYEDLDFEGDMEFSVLLVDVHPFYYINRDNIETQFIVHDSGDATVILQDAEVFGQEGTNVTVCAEIQLPGQLLSEINVQFVALSGGFGADAGDIRLFNDLAVFSPSDNVQSGDVACVTISILEDNVLEPPAEVLILNEISPLVTEPTDNPLFTRVFIMDSTSQDVLLSFEPLSTNSYSEGETFEVCVVIEDFPSGGVEIPVTLEIGTSDGDKAVLNDDYAFLGPSSITFQPEDFNSSLSVSKCVNVSILSDQAIEGDHYFDLVILSELSDPEITPGDLSTLTIQIMDTTPGSVGFAETSYEVGEEDGEVYICLEISFSPGTYLECDVNVSLTTANGTKTVLGADFVTGAEFSVTFPAFETESGDTSCASIDIINDMQLEGDEQTFSVHLDDVVPSHLMLSTAYASVTIEDSDSDDATVSFVYSSLNVSEGEAVQVCLELTNVPAEGLACQVSVYLSATSYSPIEKLAVENEDYQVLNTVVVFQTNATDGTIECVEFADITADMTLEGFHHFFVIINGTDPEINVDDDSYLSVYIADNDTAVVSPIFLIHFFVDEDFDGDRYVNACVLLDSLPAGGLECDTYVYLEARSVTALEGEDFEPFTVAILLENSTDSSPILGCESFYVPVIDDDIYEDTQIFELVLRSDSSHILVDDSSVFSIYIEDNDKVTVGFKEKEYVIEEGGVEYICLQFEEAVQRSFEVNVTEQALLDVLEGGVANLEEMYVFANESSYNNTIYGGCACNYIGIDEDLYKEGVETFVLWLMSNDSTVCFGRDQALVFVPSNDVVAVTVVDTNFTVYENEGALHLCLQVNHTIRTRAVVHISTNSDSALAGYDFVPIETYVVFDEGLDTTQCLYIPILNDECLEEEYEYFYIYLDSDQSCVQFYNDTKSFEATIIDDDCVVISFVEAEYTVDEMSGFINYLFCVDLWSGLPKRDFDFYVDVQNGTAILGYDFEVNETSLHLVYNSSYPELNCIPVSIIDDSYLEYEEYFYLLLNSSDCGVKIKTDHTVVEIVDNDAVYISLTEEYYEVSEEDGSLHVCVELYNHTERSVYASVFAIPGTASEDDYSGLPQDLLFTPFETLQCFYVNISLDSIEEEPENFHLVLVTRDPDVIFYTRTAPVYILDSDSITIGFEFPYYFINEGSIPGEYTIEQICLSVSGGSLDRTIDVIVSDEDGSAIGGEDYVQFKEIVMTITLTLGEDGANRRKRVALGPQECFNVTIIADEIVEYDDTFTLHLSTSDSDITLFPNYTTIHIINDDYANITLEMDAYEAMEGTDGEVVVCAKLVEGVLERGVTVNVSTSDLTALADEDYESVFYFPLYFEPYSPLYDLQCLNITILDDDIVEFDQVFGVAIYSNDPVHTTPNDTAIVVIIPDGDTVNITLSQTEYVVPEDVGSLSLCANFTEGVLQRDVTVYLNTANGTAFEEDDYYPLVDEPIVFLESDLPGAVRCSSVLIVEEDEVVEADQYFTVSLSASDPVYITPIQQAQVVIEDNDLARVSLTQLLYETDEDEGNATVCTELLFGILERSVTVTLNTEDISAFAPGDYTSLSNASLTYQIGDPNGTILCLDIDIYDDEIVEYVEYFSVILSSLLEPVYFEPIQEANVSIYDNDLATVTLVDSVISVNEYDNYTMVCANLTDGILDREIAIYFEALDDTALDAEDYVGFVSHSPFSFMAGDEIGTIYCFNVLIIDDDIIEPEQTFFVRANSTDPVIIAPISEVAITIIDDDVALLSLEVASLSVNEIDGSVTVCVVLVVGILQRNITAYLSSQNVSAVEPGDYAAVNEVVYFSPGDIVGRLIYVEVTINVDNIVEFNETFNVVLSSDDPSVQVVNIDQVAVTIIDNDVLSVSWEQDTYSVRESDGALTVCAVIVDGSLERDVSVAVVAFNGTALPGLDYNTTIYDIVFTSGTSVGGVACTEVGILVDDDVEELEYFDIVLQNDSLVLAVAPDTATIFISPTAVEVEIGFVLTDLTVNEGENLTICLQLSDPVQDPVSVTIAATPGTAEDLGVDYTFVNQTIVFDGSSDMVCTNLETTDDSIYEFDETLTLWLDTNDPLVILNQFGANVTILDVDEVILSVVNVTDMGMVDEGVGKVIICVSVDIELQRPVEVTGDPMSGTATAGEDFEVVPENLTATFLQEQFVLYFYIPIIDDDIAENCAETFAVIFTSVNERVNADDSMAIIQIDDDDEVEFCFIQDTPAIDGSNLTAIFELRGCAVVMCQTSTTELVDCTPPPGEVVGEYFVSDLPRSDNTGHTLTVSVIPSAQGSTTQTFVRDFRTDNAARCGVVIINKGVTVDFDNDIITVEFAGTGPGIEPENTVDEFTCIFNQQSEFIQPCSSPFNVSINDPLLVFGENEVGIRPANQESRCTQQRINRFLWNLDVEPVTLSLGSSQYTVGEADGVVQVCVVLVSGTIERDVAVLLTPSDNDATFDSDYNSTAVEITFSSGDLELCTDITIVDDLLSELNESFVVTLSSDDPVLFDVSQAEVVIIDDDELTITLSLSDGTAITVSEGDLFVQVCVDIVYSSTPFGSSQVDFVLNTDNGTAFSGEDFDGGPFNENFAVGDAGPLCFNLPIVDDDLPENCLETYTVSLASSDPRVVIGSPSSVEIQIIDNDEPQFTFFNDTPHMEGDRLDVQLELLGCATLSCADALQPFSEDCTPALGSTTRAISFPGITQVNSGGHTLVVTVTPDQAFPVQTEERRFRTDNSDRCSLIYINSAYTLDEQAGTVTFEWEGTGFGVLPQDTVDDFSCELNIQAGVPCTSPFTVPLSNPGLASGATNEIAVRVAQSFQNSGLCFRRPRNRLSFQLP